MLNPFQLVSIKVLSTWRSLVQHDVHKDIQTCVASKPLRSPQEPTWLQEMTDKLTQQNEARFIHTLHTFHIFQPKMLFAMNSGEG